MQIILEKIVRNYTAKIPHVSISYSYEELKGNTIKVTTLPEVVEASLNLLETCLTNIFQTKTGVHSLKLKRDNNDDLWFNFEAMTVIGIINKIEKSQDWLNISELARIPTNAFESEIIAEQVSHFKDLYRIIIELEHSISDHVNFPVFYSGLTDIKKFTPSELYENYKNQ